MRLSLRTMGEPSRQRERPHPVQKMPTYQRMCDGPTEGRADVKTSCRDTDLEGES